MRFVAVQSVVLECLNNTKVEEEEATRVKQLTFENQAAFKSWGDCSKPLYDANDQVFT
jgi:hypothetical protein